MTWLSRIRTYLGHDEPYSVPPHADDAQEARQAYHNAKQALTEAELRREQVREVTSSLEYLRQRNHFGEAIEIAMMRKGKNP